MGFSRQEYWSGLPFPSAGDLPGPGTEPVSPALAGGFLTTGHQLNGQEFEQAPGVGDGQGSLACCSSWGSKELDTTERLN